MKRNWLLIGSIALLGYRGGVDGEFSKPKAAADTSFKQHAGSIRIAAPAFDESGG